MTQSRLILASSSPYRRDLLERLGLEFATVSPAVDEGHINDENANDIALRLAVAKALAVAGEHPQAIIIGSDQVMTCNGEFMGKPGNLENARIQLQKMSGKTAIFSTGLCVHNPSRGRTRSSVVEYKVDFRELTTEEIERYLHAEQPFGCAGSFKSEQMGVTLVRRMQGDDPTALIGLPLIELSSMLRNEGFRLP